MQSVIYSIFKLGHQLTFIRLSFFLSLAFAPLDGWHGWYFFLLYVWEAPGYADFIVPGSI